VLAALWLSLFQFGCERTQDNRKAEPAPEAPSDTILKSDDDAKAIISKAVSAHGGEKAFPRWGCGYLKYMTKGGVVPAAFAGATVEDTFQLPGHFKRVVSWGANGKEPLMVFVVNHGKGWTKKGDGPAEPSDNAFTERTEHPFARLCSLAPFAAEDLHLTKLGPEKVNGKDAIGIRVRMDELGAVDFYFGVPTGLLLKSSQSLPGAGPDRPGVMETFLDEYKDVQGVQVPMRITGVQDGRVTLDVTLIDARFAERFEENTFAKP
jgi:hypothetical protein